MKIFISYGNKLLSKVKKIDVENQFTLDKISNGIVLKDTLVKILQENYGCSVFDYRTCHDEKKGWFELYQFEIAASDIIIFLFCDSREVPSGQIAEINSIRNRKGSKVKPPKVFCIQLYKGQPDNTSIIEAQKLRGAEVLHMNDLLNKQNSLFEYIRGKSDGLPDQSMFSYEKRIIDEYFNGNGYFKSFGLSGKWPDINKNRNFHESMFIENPIRDKVGAVRDFKNDRVLASALTLHHQSHNNEEIAPCNYRIPCPLSIGMTFPEAGPRSMIYSPIKKEPNIINPIINYRSPNSQTKKVRPLLRIGIIVSGGTAPGINAVINGIVQRHFNYYDGELEKSGNPFWTTLYGNLPYHLEIVGFHNGLSKLIQLIPNNGNEAFVKENACLLFDSSRRRKHDNSHGGHNLNFDFRITSKDLNRPGSILQTGRETELIESNQRIVLLTNILKNSEKLGINLLYIVGGEGSMRAAHALATISQNNEMGISICGIPKTMDNDILWVWKTFGFHSAVYKASEFINTLTYELKSHPRIGILQLFGSFSGYVVSHAVLGSKSKICDCAIIPEISFSLQALKKYLDPHVEEFKKSLIVIAETAFPDDIWDFGDKSILTKNEKVELEKAIKLYLDRKKQILDSIPNPTDDDLEIAREEGRKQIQMQFNGKRYQVLSHAVLMIIANFIKTKCNVDVITSEPKYLIRDVSPSPIDIIFGNRLAILAVDNMMAGYTDFMISQWLTEFCMIPLSLVVVGTKKVPKDGIFWKSVIAKTGQPEKMV
jgi:6-phosphofructokinase 1